MITIPIAEAHNRLSSLLKKAQQSPIVLTRRGKAVGILISPEEYARLREFEAYHKVLSLSQALRESGVSAVELFQSSRAELEKRA